MRTSRSPVSLPLLLAQNSSRLVPVHAVRLCFEYPLCLTALALTSASRISAPLHFVISPYSRKTMSLPTINIADQAVGKIATGLMRLTWAPKQVRGCCLAELAELSLVDTRLPLCADSRRASVCSDASCNPGGLHALQFVRLQSFRALPPTCSSANPNLTSAEASSTATLPM